MSAHPTHFGRYRVVRELGRGAMGQVWLAQDETLLREVAIKTMLLSDDAEEREQHEARFRQEAKAAGSLSHPNVITVYDLGREGHWLYIAMELLRGVELRDMMAAGGVPLALAVDIVAQVASGLAAAHAQGIVHRDVKPSNIMVQQGNVAKIMDFGVARMQTSEVRTQTGVMLGSPKYMSPEQVEGQRLDHRSDIFSLGSVLYELVTGIAPFRGNDLGSLLFDIARAQPVPARERNPSVPLALDRIITKALQRDPAQRYQDANDMAAALTQCAEEIAGGTLSMLRSQVMASPPPAGPGPDEATVASGARTQQMAATVALAGPGAGQDDDATVALPQAEAARTTPGGFTGTGTSAPAWPLAAGFGAEAALQRLARKEAAAPGAAASPVRRWVWPAAYAAAVLAAAWIVLR